MIINKNITTYIHSLEKELPEYLENLREEAETDDVPIIRREMESFIRLLMMMKKPKRILEIGTAVGYSTLFFDHCCENTEIITIENYEPRLEKARKNLAGHKNITLMEGDASLLIKDLQGTFDFIFLDAAKAQYILIFPDIMRLLEKGGVLLSDNVLQEGELVESRYATSRRQRTIHERMREFVWEVTHNDELESSLLTIGDGVTLSIKK